MPVGDQMELEPQEQEVEAPETEAEATDAPESEAAEAQESTEEGQPEAEAPEPTEELPAVTAEEPEAEPETQPFGFTADRRNFEVPGAAVVRFQENGQTVEKIVLDRETWNRYVQPQLRDTAALNRRDAEHRKQLASLEPERNETVIRARALLGSLEDVLKDEDSLTAFLSNFAQNKELWQLKAEKAVSEAKLTGYTSQETEQQQAQRQEESASQVMADIPASIQGAAQFVTQNWNVPVDQRAMQAAQQQISENIGAYYRYATAHDAQTFGVPEGQLIRDDDAVIKTIHRFATLLQKDTKVEAAKTKNAAALAGGKTPPKTVSAKGSPGAAEKARTFKTKEEWIAHMGGNT